MTPEYRFLPYGRWTMLFNDHCTMPMDDLIEFCTDVFGEPGDTHEGHNHRWLIKMVEDQINDSPIVLIRDESDLVVILLRYTCSNERYQWPTWKLTWPTWLKVHVRQLLA